MSSGAKTRVVTESGRPTAQRLFVQRLDAAGAVEAWLEVPASLKQPLMAMLADVARGTPERDFPVPGGDRLFVRPVAQDGATGLHLTREPPGFPPEGRDVTIDAGAVPLLLAQVRGV